MSESVDQCKRCGGVVLPSKAFEPVYGGHPDFPGGEVSTLSAVGAQLADCMKCSACGHSFIPAPVTP